MSVPTWEDTQYRCQICMQILSSDLGSEMCPQIVCENIHTVCKKCTLTIRQDPTPKCPQCRFVLRKDNVPNRDVIFMLSIANMRCGGCDNRVAMSCATARKHSKECSENHILCPLLNNDIILSQCTHSMSVSTLWEHCQQFHASANTNGTSLVTATPCENDQWTAMLSISLTFERNHYTFFTVTTPKTKYNMCVHVTKEESARADPKITICVRRFFAETELTFHKKIVSVEIGTMCGLLVPIPAMLSVYEDFSSLTKLDTKARADKIIEIPVSLLTQMQQGDEVDVLDAVPSTLGMQDSVLPPAESRSNSRVPVTRLKMTLSIQFWFQQHTTAMPLDEPPRSALNGSTSQEVL